MTGIPKRELPPLPHPDHLRKQAKVRLAAMRAKLPTARLAEAQSVIAREYGFASWAALQAEVSRRAASPLGQRAHVRKLHLAAFRPAWWREPDPVDQEVDAVAAFFRAAVIVQIGFILTLVAGLVIAVCLMRTSGFPWPLPIYINF
jgi:hypothetical protein